MTAKRTTRITVQRDRLLIIRQGRTLPTARCDGCGRNVEIVSLEQACELEGINSDEIGTWISSNQIHVMREDDSEGRICLPSLLRAFAGKTLKGNQAS